MYGETTKTSPRSFFAVVIVIVGLVCFIIIFRKTYCSFMQSDNDHQFKGTSYTLLEIILLIIILSLQVRPLGKIHSWNPFLKVTYSSLLDLCSTVTQALYI